MLLPPVPDCNTQSIHNWMLLPPVPNYNTQSTQFNVIASYSWLQHTKYTQLNVIASSSQLQHTKYTQLNAVASCFQLQHKVHTIDCYSLLHYNTQSTHSWMCLQHNRCKRVQSQSVDLNRVTSHLSLIKKAICFSKNESTRVITGARTVPCT